MKRDDKMKFDITLYLVTDSTNLEEKVFLSKVEQACRGGVTMLQLREKEKSDRDFLSLALEVKKITDKYGIPLIIDDRLDIALASGASGVHLGQSDMPISVARKLMGKDKIIGATTKTVFQAKKAVEEGADYLGVGAIYPTTTKVVTVITEVSTLNDICNAVDIPVLAIGGLNKDNCDVLKNSPIDGIAVVSAIMKDENPEKAASELKSKILSMIK